MASVLFLNPDRLQNAQAARVLTSNGYDVDCAETSFGAALRLKEGKKAYSLLICSNILRDGAGAPLVMDAWERWRIPTLQLTHHFKSPTIRCQVQDLDVVAGCIRGQVDVPCSDERFLEAVASTLKQLSGEEKRERAELVGTSMPPEEWALRNSTYVKFAVIVLTVEEMMDSEGLSCNEGIETIRAFVRDSLGDAVPDEFTDTIRRLGLISDERMPCEHIV